MIIDQKKVINLSITFVVTVVIFLIIQSLITRNSNLDFVKHLINLIGYFHNLDNLN